MRAVKFSDGSNRQDCCQSNVSRAQAMARLLSQSALRNGTTSAPSHAIAHEFRPRSRKWITTPTPAPTPMPTKSCPKILRVLHGQCNKAKNSRNDGMQKATILHDTVHMYTRSYQCFDGNRLMAGLAPLRIGPRGMCMSHAAIPRAGAQHVKAYTWQPPRWTKPDCTLPTSISAGLPVTATPCWGQTVSSSIPDHLAYPPTAKPHAQKVRGTYLVYPVCHTLGTPTGFLAATEVCAAITKANKLAIITGLATTTGPVFLQHGCGTLVPVCWYLVALSRLLEPRQDRVGLPLLARDMRGFTGKRII